MVLFNCEIVGEIMEILVNFNDIVCGGADVLRILRFVFILLDMVCWIVPMGLIVMLMVDFGKNVIAGKEDEMKKNLNMAIKRIIYCIILFLVPTIVNFAVGIVSNVGVEAAKCIEIARDHNNDLSQYEIDYETFEPAGEQDADEEQTGESDGGVSENIWGNTSDLKDEVVGEIGEVIDEVKDKVGELKCWRCLNNTGFVLSSENPGGSFVYANGKSFSTTAVVCAPGFEEASMDNCNENSEKKCYKCTDGSGFVLSPNFPNKGFSYATGESFNTTKPFCGPGFVQTDIDNCK